MDFHSHTYLTDGSTSATEMWWDAQALGHRSLAITDHIGTEDPKPLLERLHQEARAFEAEEIVTLVGVEVTKAPPRQLARVVAGARKAGAEIVIVHGETPVENVPAGTNRAALELNEVDVLAHPGILTEAEAELAKAHQVALELTPRRGHSLGNGLVAQLALSVGAPLVVDSDAHGPQDLFTFERARTIALGAGVPVSQLTRVLSESPEAILRRHGKL